MSHFVVLVIGGDVDRKMEPYDEASEGTPRVYATREHVETERARIAELIKQPWEEGKRHMDIYRDGGLEKMSHDEFVESWYGIPSDSEGNVITTSNEDGKWDWWVVGGRWRGLLLLKPDADRTFVECGVADAFDSPPEYPDGVDRAPFGIIDWERMQNDPDRKKQLEANWAEFVTEKGLWKPEYYLERYGTKEEYVRRNMLFTTHAVIDQVGRWYEVGAMGWWGFSSETVDDQKYWDDKFWDRFLAKLSPATMITIVDAHV